MSTNSPEPAEQAAHAVAVSSIDHARLDALVRDTVADDPKWRIWRRALGAKLEQANVLPPDEMPADVVTMNSTVRLHDFDLDETTEYTLVYPGFADSKTNRLSVLTPIGTSILGGRVGDVVAWDDDFGGGRVKIEAIEHQPESAGQYDT